MDTLPDRPRYTEEEALALLTKEFTPSPLSAKLFGPTMVTDVQRAIERHGVLELDSLLLQGAIDFHEASTCAAVDPDIAACRMELLAAARAAADHFATGRRALYYVEKMLARPGKETENPLIDLSNATAAGSMPLMPDTDEGAYSLRDFLLIEYRVLLWGLVVQHLAHAAWHLPGIGRQRWMKFMNSVILRNTKHWDTSDIDPFDHQYTIPLMTHQFIEFARHRYQDDVEQLDVDDGSKECIEDLALLVMERRLAPAQCTIGPYPVLMDAPAADRRSYLYSTIAEFNFMIADTEVRLTVDPGLQRVALRDSGVPLEVVWPELAARVTEPLLRFLRQQLEQAPEDPIELPAVLAPPRAADIPIVPTFDWQAYRDEQLRIRAEVHAAVPAKVATLTIAPRLIPAIPAVESAAAAAALEKLLGPALRSSGSHHVFQGRSGKRCPFPVHPGRDVGIGLLKKCLRVYGLPLEEFLAALR